MKLKAVKLQNFRGYRGNTLIPIDDLTALVGKNDIGKSSILDAIGIFLGAPNLKLDAGDKCVHAADHEVRIACIFTELPDKVVIDATATTTLSAELLLNADGDLEIHRVFECKDGKVADRGFWAAALHPTAQGAGDLLLLKNTDLKKRASDLKVGTSNVDLRCNSALRTAIRSSIEDLRLQPTEIPLNKEDAKAIWEQLSQQLPAFAIFRADRPSTDEDTEAQDPMQVAVKQAVAEMMSDLERVKTKVQDSVLKVADRTLKKLQELDPRLGSALTPKFKNEPKWDSIFKLSLDSDDGIPLNKRGSGLRRLVLLSFFRAEAERRRLEKGQASIIYAIEEPEASQHPENQKMLVEALQDLATTDGCQVILTTHVPGLAGLIPVCSIRHVTRTVDGTTMIEVGDESTYRRVADDLGVLPDSRVRVLVCVEGPNDVQHLTRMSRCLRSETPMLPDIENDPRIAVIALGGENLRDWVRAHYLRNLGIPEIHLFDRGSDDPPKYQGEANSVNGRSDGSIAFITNKRELENYLHAEAIEAKLSVCVTVTDDCNVPELVAEATHSAATDPHKTPWNDLTEKVRGKKVCQAKRRLNTEAVDAMTPGRIDERGGKKEVVGWLEAIGKKLEQ